MTGKFLILLLFAAVLILGACSGGSTPGDLPAPGSDVRAVQLVGCEVNNSNGTWLGEVTGVLLDPETGKIAYLVLFYQEPWVHGQALTVKDPKRFIPIPWAWFTPGPREGALNLGADEMTLIPAPYLEQAPAFLDAAQALAVDDYWQSADGKVN